MYVPTRFMLKTSRGIKISIRHLWIEILYWYPWIFLVLSSITNLLIGLDSSRFPLLGGNHFERLIYVCTYLSKGILWRYHHNVTTTRVPPPRTAYCTCRSKSKALTLCSRVKAITYAFKYKYRDQYIEESFEPALHGMRSLVGGIHHLLHVITKGDSNKRSKTTFLHYGAYQGLSIATWVKSCHSYKGPKPL